MAVHKIKQGLDLPIVGEPKQTVETARQPSRVAHVAADYHGMKPTMYVEVGDQVRRGQLLFEDKKTPGVHYTSLAAGKVVAINRGAKRALESVVVELNDDEKAGRGASIEFKAYQGKDPAELSRDDVKALLIESGFWTALRRRPFNKVPAPESVPRSIFVTAMDSSPLAPKANVVLEGHGEDFQRGLSALGRLTDGSVFVCTDESTSVQLPSAGSFQHERFSGPHPSGTVGFHIHTLDPVDRNKEVWHLGYQDVIAIGKLFHTGELSVRRVVSLAGPPVTSPRLLETRLGAAIDDLVAGEHSAAEARVISGDVLSGRSAMGDRLGYLGRYSNQISVLAEDREREFLGWLGPGGDKFSLVRAFTSALTPGKKFAFTTTTNGSHRAIVPIGLYEKVFPFDILPAFLARSLVVGDIEQAEALGALELAEEDMALCSFVCPGKIDYGVHLRDVLTTIEKEG